MCFQQAPRSDVTEDREEIKEKKEQDGSEAQEEESAVWPSQRVCHTHERAVPIQETVEALDITEEGKIKPRFLVKMVGKEKKPNPEILLTLQVWKRCSATWSCTPSDSLNFSTQRCPSVQSAATTDRDSSRNSRKCTRPRCSYHAAFVFAVTVISTSRSTVAPRLPWCWPGGAWPASGWRRARGWSSTWWRLRTLWAGSSLS